MKLSDYLTFIIGLVAYKLLCVAFDRPVTDEDWTQIMIILAMGVTVNAVRSERKAKDPLPASVGGRL